MFIIVGLGNPGREYAMTRHNMGFMAVDLLAERFHIEVKRQNFRAVFGEGYMGAHKVVLAKPMTFMNNSGWSVMELVNWYKCAHEELILLYDDIELPVGDIRVRKKGSSGTHNGMRSVICQLGFDDFPRVRVGVGSAQYDLRDHVLSIPQGEERELLMKALHNTVDAVEMIVKGDLDGAASKYNHKKKPRSAEEKEDTGEA